MNSGTSTSGPSVKIGEGRRWFSLRERLDTVGRYFGLGYFFALPIVVAFLSIKSALAILAVEALGYYIGMMIYEFDKWYNYRTMGEKLEGEEEWCEPLTESRRILKRFNYFRYKYGISLDDVFLFLDRPEIPIRDNLDWIELVSIVNDLSLHVGQRFDEDDTKGNE